MLGNKMRRAGIGMTHHEHIGIHGFQIPQGVHQGFAFGRRGFGNIEIEDVGRQSLGGQLEGGAGAGAVFKEQIHHGFAAQ